MRFEWDPEKAESNFRKHGITFALAELAFHDPLFRESPNRVVMGEERYMGFGMVRDLLLSVVFTVRHEEGEEIVRIISAREASRAERRAYERGA